MLANLYLIRHGETEGAGERRYKGTIDVPLSENGYRQIEKTALLIREILRRTGTGLSAVYSSDLIRSRKSAELVASVFGLVPQVIPGLRERHFGVWEGMTFNEIAAQYPEAFTSWKDDPLHFSPIDGESTLEVKERAMQTLVPLLDRHQGETLCIVAHGGINRVILAEFLGLPLQHIFRIEQDFACLNIVEIWDGFPVVTLLNGGEHWFYGR